MSDSIATIVKKWIISLFVSAINRTSQSGAREAVVRWLIESRDILSNGKSRIDQFKELNSIVSTRAVASEVVATVTKSVMHYKESTLPWPVKIALPSTLVAAAFLGGQGVGIAAFGTAIGAPALLLVFLGAAGLTSIIEAVINNPNEASRIGQIINEILEQEQLRAASAKMKAAMRERTADPNRFDMPDDELELQNHLLALDPYLFELHVMGIFQSCGLISWVTKKSNDWGIDGFAVHREGLIVAQCKRNAKDNKISRPEIQKFKGAVEDNGGAWRAYFVTTSSFTDGAYESAEKTQGLFLVDMPILVKWHKYPPFQKPTALLET